MRLDPFELAEGERWYVVQALAKRETSALYHLSEQQFRTFLPVIAKTVRHARKTRLVRAALFPGYLFVALDLQRDRWRSINGTIGVARLVMTQTSPTPLPFGIVERLLDYRDEDGACRFDRDLVVGQTVRIVQGPLAELMGELVRLDANGRVRVLLDMLGGQVPATVERSALEAA
ncbi:transcriptional antiterminator RfaH [Rhodoblastus sphagnicola]|nr:transcription termination/antitermination NusG family protein [Rhodoblastus sphagnicola]MBB4200300.1 transcriptional antiterminator RfaH [Rhodoblastus sphagnicola]